MTRRPPFLPFTTPKGKSRFNNQRTVVDGHKFDSKKEARRYQELRLREHAGEISGLEVHPVYQIVVNGLPVRIRSDAFPNGRPVSYIADFRYTDRRTGELVVEDCKGTNKPKTPSKKSRARFGTDTDVSRLKRALVESIYGVRVRVV